MSNSSVAAEHVRRFRTDTDEIRYGPEPIGARIAVLLTVALFICAAVTLCVARVDRIVTSSAGKVISSESLTTVQSLDPAIIKSVDVRQGDLVRKGQLLGTLDPTFATADVKQLEQQVAGFNAQIARDEAELSGAAPQFARTTDYEVKYADLQADLYRQRQAQYKAQVNSFDAKIAETTATVAKLRQDTSRYKEREQIAGQIQGMRDTLVSRGAGTLLNALTSKDQRIELQRTIENNENGLAEATQALASAKADREAFVQQWLTQASQDLVTARQSRDSAVAQLEKASRHKDLVRIVASQDSYVLTVDKPSVGAVLNPNEQMMTLVSATAPLQADVKISAREIGFVRNGDPVTLKVDAFSFAEHGGAEGHLVWISEGAFTLDDNNQPTEPYYKARAEITAMNFVNVPPGFRLIPGMTLTADVHVGTRSLGAYILGGVSRGVGESMREP